MIVPLLQMRRLQPIQAVKSLPQSHVRGGAELRTLRGPIPACRPRSARAIRPSHGKTQGQRKTGTSPSQLEEKLISCSHLGALQTAPMVLPTLLTFRAFHGRKASDVSCRQVPQACPLNQLWAWKVTRCSHEGEDDHKHFWILLGNGSEEQ